MLSRRSYHQWWLMVATLIVYDPELATVLSGTHLLTSEEWKAELAWQRKDIMRSDHHGKSNPVHSHGSRMVCPLCVFALKNSYCKTFRKTAENPRKDCNFLLLSGFFSEHRYGFAFAMTYCLQKVKVGKNKVLGRNSFDSFFLIISLTNSSITISL